MPLESSDLEAYIAVAEDITRTIFLSFYIPGASYMFYLAIRYTEWSKIFRGFAKALIYGPGPAKDESQTHNHLQGLKDIGQTYIGETYTVFRQGFRNKRPKEKPEEMFSYKLQGLKDIGQTYIRETYIVFRQGSFNQSSRK